MPQTGIEARRMGDYFLSTLQIAGAKMVPHGTAECELVRNTKIIRENSMKFLDEQFFFQ
jgi:hypothetical protein